MMLGQQSYPLVPGHMETQTEDTVDLEPDRLTRLKVARHYRERSDHMCILTTQPLILGPPDDDAQPSAPSGHE